MRPLPDLAAECGEGGQARGGLRGVAKVRACVLEKGLEHCGCCEQYPCGIFPAEPSDEEVRRRIEVEKLWTWEDEKLMEAYACRKHMDEFREKR